MYIDHVTAASGKAVVIAASICTGLNENKITLNQLTLVKLL